MNKLKIFENKSFGDLTTFRIGGRVRFYTEVKNEADIEEAVCFAKSNNLKLFIVGGGSDFLASDATFDGLVIKYTGTNFKINDDDTVTAEGGMVWDDLVGKTVAANLSGIECLSGIPGSVGASPIQNIGAYGQELKDTFVNLTAYDTKEEKFVVFDKNDCKFGYRESVFKEKHHWQRYIITRITLKLHKSLPKRELYESLKNLVGEDSSLREIRQAVLKVRGEKLEDPKVVGNAGSFFKNPIISKEKKEELERVYPDARTFPFGEEFKVSAAWLIDKLGWKGAKHNEAAVSDKHALILVNRSGKASAKDILELSEKIIKDVKKNFGITLEREVQLINF